MHFILLFLLFCDIIEVGKLWKGSVTVKRSFKTQNYSLTYSQNHVDTHVLWENHCHALYEAIAVLNGDVNITLEGRNYRLTENTVIIIPPMCYHTIAANKSGEYIRMTAFFNKTAIPPILLEEFVRRDAAPVIFDLPWRDDLKRIFATEPSPFYAPLIESMMTQLFYKRIEASDSTDAEDEANRFIMQIISYIDEHLLDRIALDDLAKHTARSKSFVCHLFEEKMGIPPRQYILQKRMAYAEMLISEGESATALAASMGYKSYASFYRMYQKHCGQNPLKSKPKKA